jgi:hypothetical protein
MRYWELPNTPLLHHSASGVRLSDDKASQLHQSAMSVILVFGGVRPAPRFASSPSSRRNTTHL